MKAIITFLLKDKKQKCSVVIHVCLCLCVYAHTDMHTDTFFSYN